MVAILFAAQKLRACAISFSPLTMQLLLVQPPGWRGDSFIYKAPLQTLLCSSPCSHSSVCRQFLDARPLAASFHAARSCLILFSSPRVFWSLSSRSRHPGCSSNIADRDLDDGPCLVASAPGRCLVYLFCLCVFLVSTKTAFAAPFVAIHVGTVC